MIPLWRFTRNRYARAVYDALQAVGVIATRMYEYGIDLDRTRVPPDPSLPEDVSVEIITASELRNRGLDVDFSIPVTVQDGEVVVVVRAGGTPIGRTVVNSGTTPYVHALERSITVPGLYVRRVFVVPERRGEGIASAALARAVAHASEAFDAGQATALIAADNRPSQWLFEGYGFGRVGRHEYLRVGPLSRYRRREV